MSCRIRAVGNKENFPFVRFTDDCWAANCPRPGYSVDFLKMTLQLMNCSLEVVPIDASAEESVQLISNGSADISLLALRQTIRRMEFVEFTSPVNFLYYGYLIKEVPQLKVEDYILSSFQYDALGLMFLAGLIVGCLVFFYTQLFHYQVGSMFHWMVLCCQAFLRQFNCHLPGPIAAHMLVGFWLYFCILIVANYEAKLKSFLTLSHARGTYFTELDGVIEAVENGGYRMIIQEDGYSPMLYCKPEQCRKLELIPHNKIIRLTTDQELLDYVDQPNMVGFIAFTADITSAPISFVDVKRRLLFVKDTVAEPDMLAYAVARNTTLREQFSRAVTLTSPGFPTVRSRYMRAMPPYQDTYSAKQEVTVLQFSHLRALFNICFEILCLAVIAIIFEILLYRYGNRSYRCVRSCFPSFRHKLHINRSLSKHEFPRRQVVVLPPHLSASPETKLHQRFSVLKACEDLQEVEK